MHPLLLSDEMKHKEKIETHGVDWYDSTFVINNVKFWGSEYADVQLTETVCYIANGETGEEAIDHIFHLVGSGTDWDVIDDEYYERISEFKSCSYSNPSDTSEIMITGDGSSSCIIEIAKGEIGTGEYYTQVTKYNDWYYGRKYAKADWCVIFVSWCANHVDIPVSVIPKSSGTGNLKKFFSDRGRFDYTPARNGEADPKAGDIIFFQGIEAETGHVAIVSAVSGTTVTYIEGNNANAKVGSDSIEKTSARIVGYGRPAYQSGSHNYLWQSNNTHHWKRCENCGKTGSKTVHVVSPTWSTDSTYHWKMCTTCFTSIDKAPHTTIQNSATGKEECLTCGYESSININTVPEETSGTE